MLTTKTITQQITCCSECGRELKSADDWSKCKAQHSLESFRNAVGVKKYAEYVDWFNTFMKDALK